MRSAISSEGRITVPVKLRRSLGLRASTMLVFELQDDGVILRKAVGGEHSVDAVFGTFKEPSVDALELLDAMRGPRPGGPRRPRSRKPGTLRTR